MPYVGPLYYSEKQLVVKHFRRRIAAGVLPRAQVRLRFEDDATKEPSTAWHRYAPLSKSHHIVLNAGALPRLATAHPTFHKRGTRRWNMACAVLDHEISHGAYTTRDREGLNAALKAHGVAFELWNLFEDARIENLWRVQDKRGRFNWVRWLDPDVDGAHNLFLSFKNAEKNKAETDRVVTLAASKGIAPKAAKVLRFYRAATNPRKYPTSESLVPLCAAFAKAFPGEVPSYSDLPGLDPDRPPNTGRNDDGGLEPGEVHVMSPGFQNPLESDGEVQAHTIDREASCYLSDSAAELQVERGADPAALEAILSRFLTRGEGKVRTPTHGRVDVRHLLRGSERIYSARRRTDHGIPNVALILDMSGSMGGLPMINSKSLILAFNRLAQKGRITGSLTLTCERIVPLVLPLQEATLMRLWVNGSNDNFGTTTRRFVADLAKADIVVGLTDAQFTGEKNCLARLRKNGLVRMIGLYCAEVSASTYDSVRGCMAANFQASVIRSTPQEAAFALGKLIRV